MNKLKINPLLSRKLQFFIKKIKWLSIIDNPFKSLLNKKIIGTDNTGNPIETLLKQDYIFVGNPLNKPEEIPISNIQNLQINPLEKVAQINAGAYALEFFKNYLIIGAGQKIWISSNFSTFTNTFTTSQLIISLKTFGTNIYCATQYNGILYKSSDGVNWTVCKDFFEAQLTALYVFQDKLWVAADNKIYYTTDGINFTLSYTFNTYNILSFTVFKDNLYVCSDKNIYKLSGNLNSWITVFSNEQINAVYYLFVFKNELFAGISPGLVFKSSDGVNWTKIYDTNSAYVRSFNSLNNLLYVFTGNPAAVYKSSDGIIFQKMYAIQGNLEILGSYCVDDYIYCVDTNAIVWRFRDGIHDMLITLEDKVWHRVSKKNIIELLNLIELDKTGLSNNDTIFFDAINNKWKLSKASEKLEVYENKRNNDTIIIEANFDVDSIIVKTQDSFGGSISIGTALGLDNIVIQTLLPNQSDKILKLSCINSVFPDILDKNIYININSNAVVNIYIVKKKKIF